MRRTIVHAIVRAVAAVPAVISAVVLAALVLVAAPAKAQSQLGVWEVPVTVDQSFEPLPIAIVDFQTADPGLAGQAGDITGVLSADLESTGLFALIPKEAFIESGYRFGAVPNYNDWRVINAAALVTGEVARAPDGRLLVRLRLFDTYAEEEIEALEFAGAPTDWRRFAHKVADSVYTQLTGEGPYFDSRVVFVDETGPKGDRRKRLAVMDMDGANVRYVPGAEGLVLSPRFEPNQQSLLYISYDTGEPQVFLLSLATGQRERLGTFPGMTFAPRFSPDGSRIALSLSQGGNTDIYVMGLAGRQLRRLTSGPGIETSPDFSPDGTQIVYESDQGGRPQLYIMDAAGGGSKRISFGAGSYGTPVWSPKGDLIAFTKILGGRFHIGVMRTDGSEERLLTASFLDEGPTWAPNGRVLMFFRETPGPNGAPAVYSIDVTGRNLRRVPTPNAASDPAWSPLRTD